MLSYLLTFQLASELWQSQNPYEIVPSEQKIESRCISSHPLENPEQGLPKPFRLCPTFRLPDTTMSSTKLMLLTKHQTKGLIMFCDFVSGSIHSYPGGASGCASVLGPLYSLPFLRGGFILASCPSLYSPSRENKHSKVDKLGHSLNPPMDHSRIP